MSDTTTTTTATAGHQNWSSRWAFVLAATGSAVGLGNIWKFPYITGENGGGAFVLVYLLCIAAVGLPILIAEIMLGRKGAKSPIASMRDLISKHNASSGWVSIGAIGTLAAFLILSFYSVIGGWAINYVGYTVSGDFIGKDGDAVGGIFGAMLADPSSLLFWHSVFMALTLFIVARGVKGGLEKAVTWLMPALFALLIVMVIYAMTTTGFAQGVSFLLTPDFSKLTQEGVLKALGHAFFTLSLGTGVMMAYGSYLNHDVSIGRTSITVGLMDTVVALVAGLAIFPIVFANGMEPGAGPGLIFVSLPLAFGSMSLGTIIGTLFFVLLVFAALTSAISLLEPSVEWLEERSGFNRVTATLVAGGAVWFLGIATVLSLNLWSDVHPLGMIPAFEGKTIFDLLDYVTANIMLPLAGLLAALYVGWVMKKEEVAEELSLANGPMTLFWNVTRYITPAAVIIVFMNSIGLLG
ncbi:sodium-dependent transporter [Oceanospirillum sediminis]|uniref:Transporter n=1 Tax=Oceanospirillum sediminis TaxID=2760088 RepID=A0A839IPL8_9GAMM|nr:sodium-dependent transporter [Oceanospirillum sediminis]